MPGVPTGVEMKIKGDGMGWDGMLRRDPENVGSIFVFPLLLVVCCIIGDLYLRRIGCLHACVPGCLCACVPVCLGALEP